MVQLGLHDYEVDPEDRVAEQPHVQGEARGVEAELMVRVALAVDLVAGEDLVSAAAFQVNDVHLVGLRAATDAAVERAALLVAEPAGQVDAGLDKPIPADGPLAH